MERIYVDNAATTPTHPEVVEAMLPYLTEHFGNPSSIHSYGRKSKKIIDEARTTIAQSLQAKPNEIIFTSGGTEADNLALIGSAMANRQKGNHIITTNIEHHAVLHTCQFLEDNGFDVTYLPVNEDGLISLEALKSAITDKTILVSIMYVNNEVGTIQPIKDIANLLKEKDIIFHTDAVQAYGLLEMNMEELPIDLVSISAHKINGPKGIGCLYVRSGVKISSLSYGGEQERKRRAGTENVASIAAFKRAVEITQQKREERFAMYHQYRKKMLEIFTANGINFIENGQADNVLPNILNVSFLDVQAEAMLMNLDLAGISASSGSACTAGAIEPSHVIVSMYGEEHECLEHAIRFSFGYNNTMKQIEYVANTASEIVKRIIK